MTSETPNDSDIHLLTDQELIDLILEGTNRGFRIFEEWSRKILFSAIYSVFWNEIEEYEAIMFKQDFEIKMHTNELKIFKNFRGECKLSVYLFDQMQYFLMDYIRKYKKWEKRYKQIEDYENMVESTFTHSDTSDTLDYVYSYVQERLSEKDAVFFRTLYPREGVYIPEVVAERLNISRISLDTRKSRFLHKKLKPLLNKLKNEIEVF